MISSVVRWATVGAEGRALFVEQVASCLISGGVWFSFIGNKDEIVEPGKESTRLSVTELAISVEPSFEILRLKFCLLESRSLKPPRFWHV